MKDGRDPRVFFAAERTLLAWVRTGLTVVGIGFVVARFGLFLRLMARETHGADPGHASTYLGVAFVLLGSSGIALGILQFARFVRTLDAIDKPVGYRLGASVVFSALLAVIGLLLAVYLLVRSEAA